MIRPRFFHLVNQITIFTCILSLVTIIFLYQFYEIIFFIIFIEWLCRFQTCTWTLERSHKSIMLKSCKNYTTNHRFDEKLSTTQASTPVSHLFYITFLKFETFWADSGLLVLKRSYSILSSSWSSHQAWEKFGCLGELNARKKNILR